MLDDVIVLSYTGNVIYFSICFLAGTVTSPADNFFALNMVIVSMLIIKLFLFMFKQDANYRQIVDG